MQSDLAAMARSGGGLPRFENVRVTGWAPKLSDRPAAGREGAGSNATGSDPTESSKGLAIAAIVVVAVAVAAIAGYFIYTAFFSH